MLTEIVDENSQTFQQILAHLRRNVEQCLYIYIDLVKYGLRNPSMKLWAGSDDGDIQMVVMKYHDSFQIFAGAGRWQEQDVAALISRYQPGRISGSEDVIRRLEDMVAADYDSVYGKIFCGRESRLLKTEARRCETAGPADIPEIVALLRTDREFREQYTDEELQKQMEERYRTGMGRSFILRQEGRIIGHIGTFAEVEDIAILSGTVVHKDFRHTDAFASLSEEVFQILCREEGKRVYYFITNRRMLSLYSRINPPCASYGKLMKRRREDEMKVRRQTDGD